MDRVVEISVYIKTYAAYNHRGRTSFIGLRDSRAYEELTVESQSNLVQTERLNSSPENTGIINLLYPFPSLESVRNKTLPHESLEVAFLEEKIPLHDEGNLFLRSLAGDFVNRNARFYDKNKFSDDIPGLFERYPIQRPDESRIVDVDSGTYVDIFRKSSDGKVYLRAEYQFGTDGLWHPVSVLNLNDDRTAQAGGGDHINIPSNQECFLMLSKIKQKSSRLEQIRQTLERDGHARNCPRVTAFGKLDNIKEDLEQLKVLSGSAPVPEDLLANRPDLENALFEEDLTNPTLLVPDFEGYGKILYDQFETAYTDFTDFIGNSDDEQHLAYLVSITCDQYDCWNRIKGDENGGDERDLKEQYQEYKNNAMVLNFLANRLAWWIVQPEYQDMLYDYLYYYENDSNDINFKNTIDQLFAKPLSFLYKIETTAEALQYLYEQAYNLYKEALFHKNYPDPGARDRFHFEDRQFDSYWRNSSGLNDDFTSLELYTDYKGKNWLLESFHSKAKQGVDISFKILECFAKPIVNTEGKRFGIEKLPEILSSWLQRVSKDSKIIVEQYEVCSTDFFIGSTRYTGDLHVLSYSTTGRDSATKLADSDIAGALKKCMATFNLAMAVYYMQKRPSLSNGVQLLGAAIEFGKVCRFIELGNTKGFAKFVLKNAGDVVVVVLGVISFFELTREGDMEAAFIKGVGSIMVGVLGILFGSNPVVALLLALVLIGINLVGDSQVSSEFEKWVGYGRYGEDFEALTNITNGDYPSRWERFYDRNLLENLIQKEKNTTLSIEDGTNRWTIENEDEEKSLEEYQIECYYRIISDFAISWKKVVGFSRVGYYGRPDTDQMDLLRIEFTCPVLDPKDSFEMTLKAVQYDGDSYEKTYELNGSNSYVKMDEDEGYKVSTYIYFSPKLGDFINSRGRGMFDQTKGARGIQKAARYFGDYEDSGKIKTDYIEDNELIRFCNAGFEYETFEMLVKYFPSNQTEEEKKPLITKRYDKSLPFVTWSTIG